MSGVFLELTLVRDQRTLSTYTLTRISLVTAVNKEAMQAFGYYLDLPPRFFSMKAGQLSTGNKKIHCICASIPSEYQLITTDSSFSINFIDKYKTPLRPSACRAEDQPLSFDFQSTESVRDHVWHTTCVNVIFVKAENEKTFRGLVQIDPLDETAREGLKTLMMRTEIATPGAGKDYTGIAQVLFAIVRIVTRAWKMLLKEAETYLNKMVRFNPPCSSRSQDNIVRAKSSLKRL